LQIDEKEFGVITQINDVVDGEDVEIIWIKYENEDVLENTKPDNWREHHIDHIRPLFSFDLTDSKQMKEANSAENLQWLTAKENIKKGSKYNYKEVENK